MGYFRTVLAADGRQWTIQRTLEWSEPVTAQDFEHDMDGGRTAAFVILSFLLVFWVVLAGWFLAKKDEVVLPWWLLLVALLVVLFFPARWVVRRPRTIVAQTLGDLRGLPPERWLGTVRGFTRSREETDLVIKSLETRATPAYADSPLQPVS